MRPTGRIRNSESRLSLMNEFWLSSGDLLRIREKREDDGDAIGAMLERCGEKTYYYFHPYELGHESGLAVARDSEILCHLALNMADDVVGYVWLEQLNRDVPTLGICVADDWQGRGVGRHLMQISIEVARSVEKTGVRLTVNQDNARGQALYQKVGFVRTREVDGRFPSYEMRLNF